tara:strand:- start:831 stop:1175 length:345 start_codon:yes stop_codon:yes gene_type:complete
MTVWVSKQFENINDGIQNMLAAATHDYNEFCSNENMQQEFAKGWVVKEGQKYIKILTRNGESAWGFIVNTDNDKKFKKGDVLKCAGFNAPARNAARGNVLNGGFNIQWTGPIYL